MYLYGASGHAKVIMDILAANKIPIEALVDDNAELDELQGIPVIHSAEGCSPFIISIGNNKIRKMIAERLQTDFISVIHPSAIISSSASIDEGTVVMHGAIVQADAKIGKHCIINTAATIDHECVIGDYVHISPNASLCGNVQVGEGTWIGAGATVIPCVKIGKWSVIGAGSVVLKDIPDGVVAYGNSCKVSKCIKTMDKINHLLIVGGGKIFFPREVYRVSDLFKPSNCVKYAV